MAGSPFTLKQVVLPRSLAQLIRISNGAVVETLERLHSDPFDLLLIVQARQEGLRFVDAR
jgi:PIN domain nuclease of toxin-antitoxin system